MDTSERYVKMCEGAHKVIHPNKHIFLFDLETLYWDVDSKRIWAGWEITHKFKIYGSISTTDFREYFPIYRQDQLQEMVEYKDLNHAMSNIYVFYCEYLGKFADKTWEQLWLAFVMKERFNKMWDGSKWE